MSAFSNLDASPNAQALLSYLDETDRGLSAMKAYVAATAQRYAAGQRVLDLGCGVGHDLERLGAYGLAPVGVDASETVLARAKATGHPLVRGDATRLPFATAVFAGCRVERLLQHVAHPGAVIDEVLRVVRPGGLVAVFEPDWTTFRVASDLVPDGSLPARLVTVRHPTIGTQVADLLRTRGCAIDDVVSEQSFGYTLDRLPLNAAVVTQRGVDDGVLDPELRADWLAEQQQRSYDGTFTATWTKILTVAYTAIDADGETLD